MQKSFLQYGDWCHLSMIKNSLYGQKWATGGPYSYDDNCGSEIPVKSLLPKKVPRTIILFEEYSQPCEMKIQVCNLYGDMYVQK